MEPVTILPSWGRKMKLVTTSVWPLTTICGRKRFERSQIDTVLSKLNEAMPEFLRK